MNRWILLLCVFTFWGCGPLKQAPDSGASVTPEGSEESYKATPIAITGNKTTINGLGRFQYRSDIDGSVNNYLGIPFAEFRILNSSGQIIQQGETDVNGNITAEVPRAAGTLTLRVHSRADNSHYRASVLDSPYDKNYYIASTSFTLAGNEVTYPTTVTVTASADSSGTMTGAAFNILYQIYLTNKYLKDQLGGSFEISQKAQTYWKKGVTPAIYFGGSGAISYYVPSSSDGLYEGIYILGGINGSLCVDTDHFDNSIIVHEYAHFLEHKLSNSDSPGGSHSGNSIIDPRLAWSEGFANFLQGAVLGRSFYRDTSALGCGNQNLTQLEFNLKRTGPSDSDIPLKVGEGNFREMSIARYLYGTISDHGSTGVLYPGFEMDFDKVWNAFLDLSNTNYKGRSIHHFNRSLISSLSGAELTNFTNNFDYDNPGTSPLAREKQSNTLTNWAKPLVTSASPCSANADYGIDADGYFRFQTGVPTPDRKPAGGSIGCGETATIAWSDMFNSNDFFVLNLTAPSSASLAIEYSAVGGGTPYDLDLYLYLRDFTFLNTSDILRKSERYYPEQSGSGYEVVSLSEISSGNSYFVNVKVDRPACTRATTRYRMRLGSLYLCPSTTETEN